MARATWVLGATTLLGFGLSAYLLVENHGLRDSVGDSQPHEGAAPTVAATQKPDPWAGPIPRSATIPTGPAATRAAEDPKLPDKKEETKMERRARRTLEIAAMLGRHEGETDDEYRARIVPLVSAGLSIPRERANEMRKAAQEAAHVTPAQSAALDKAFEKTYGDVLDYTNKAIADGTLSPYERNVSGWLEIAGGMGTMLGETQANIAKILDPGQVKAMSDAGFEWGEYLGFNAPWEKLTPPPAPPTGR